MRGHSTALLLIGILGCRHSAADNTAAGTSMFAASPEDAIVQYELVAADGHRFMASEGDVRPDIGAPPGAL